MAQPKYPAYVPAAAALLQYDADGYPTNRAAVIATLRRVHGISATVAVNAIAAAWEQHRGYVRPVRTQLLPSIRVTAAQRKQLEAEAEADGRSLGDYIRRKLFNN